MGIQTRIDDKLFLGSRERWTIGLFASVLFCLGFGLAYNPPKRIAVQRDHYYKIISRTDTDAETSTVIVCILTLGSSLFFLAINGIRLQKFSFAGLSGENKSFEADVEKNLTAQDPEPPTEIKIEDEEPPVPNPDIVREEHLYYRVETLPIKVISDTYSKLEKSEKSLAIGAIKLAKRKKGKGNHHWIIEFTNGRVYRVSYGGQGKPGSTVSREDGGAKN